MTDTGDLGAWDIADDEDDDGRCPSCGAGSCEPCDLDCGEEDDDGFDC
jgi:hypothetical protein